MSTKASISYHAPHYFVHIADELLDGTVYIEVCDGIHSTSINVTQDVARKIGEELTRRFPPK